MKKTTTTPPSAAGADAPTSCKELGCGSRGTKCDCNSMCKKYNDCCSDYEDMCLADDSKPHDSAAPGHAAKAKEKGSLADSSDSDHVEAGSRKHSKTLAKASTLSKACRQAEQDCNKAITWAKAHGLYEHPEWYKGLTATSPDEDFQKLLAKTKHGSCDKVCAGEKESMVFLKK